MSTPKLHIHDEQFDGHPHAWCGRGSTAVGADQFEAAESALRCKVCERDWFPCGQPEWHRKAAQERLAAP
jgi:hypothetical protein